MCGRFANTDSLPQMATMWSSGVAEGASAAWSANADIRPTNRIPVLLQGVDRPRRIGLMRWGWPREFAETGHLTVARSDALRVRPTYRDVWASRRCLLPATAWYEWQELPAGSPKRARKPKYRLHPTVDGPWAMAGLWEPLPGPAKAATALLITVDAHGSISVVHERMPAIVPMDLADRWLLGDPDDAFAALSPSAGFAEPVA